MTAAGELIDAALLERFRTDLDALIAPGARLGLAVSGGADSLALLLLAAALRPGDVEAATVDHGLRPEAAEEAAIVGKTCDSLGVAHSTLVVRWDEKPRTAVQERARKMRYRQLAYWAEERSLDALVTGHHADDQAETLLMRLARGSGVRGLAGMRARSVAHGSDVRLLRPLLSWRRRELEEVCQLAGVAAISDPSNSDERFERVRVRRSLASLEWLDPAAAARSAAILAEADDALNWAAKNAWREHVMERTDSLAFRPAELPAEIIRRIVARMIRRLATEGDPDLRGRELDRLIETLSQGAEGTLRGVRCTGGQVWRFSPAPPR